MAEAPSSKCVSEAHDTINKVRTNAVSTSSASASPVNLLLCDYVKLRKVPAGTQKVKRTLIDKKLKVRHIANH